MNGAAGATAITINICSFSPHPVLRSFFCNTKKLFTEKIAFFCSKERGKIVSKRGEKYFFIAFHSFNEPWALRRVAREFEGRSEASSMLQ
jgi:hypothetical protein